MKTCAVVPAAGRGMRMGGENPKQFIEISGTPILVYTLGALLQTDFLDQVILVVPGGGLEKTEKMLHGFGFFGPSVKDQNDVIRPHFSLVEGGEERQASVFNALEVLPPACSYVMIHDGVRPFVSSRLLTETWKAALANGAAIAAVPATDTVKRVRDRKVQATLEREEIWLVQTPQVFRTDVIVEAYRAAKELGWSATDDASLVERTGHPVTIVPGERTNIKITTPEDLRWAEWFIQESATLTAG